MEHQPVTDEVLTAAEKHFGISYLYPYQRLVIANVLEAIDATDDQVSQEDRRNRQIIILPTGAGKSLCFQIPARIRRGLTVVLFPLLSLMGDQARRLEESGWSPYVLSGGLTPEERSRLWREVSRSDRAIILTNPESTIAPAVRSRLRSIGVTHLVIDEAHCVTEWGESFRPAYRSITDLIEEVEPKVVTAFTATASDRIISDLKEVLSHDGAHLIQADPDRPNISYTLLPSLSRARSLRLLYGPRPAATARTAGPGGRAATACMAGHDAAGPPAQAAALPVMDPAAGAPVPSIIFCRSRHEAEQTARELRHFLPRERVYFYHAGLSREEKKSVEAWFFASTDGVLAATCAYGMGVDKKNVRSVLHLAAPATVESYLQESGRAGRDRGAAQAALLLSPSDLLRSQVPAYLEALLAPGCRRSALMDALGAPNDNCSGCDRCNASVLVAPPPPVAPPRARRWGSLSGNLLTDTLAGSYTPEVREAAAFLSPYWNRCAGWLPAELEEAKEELRALGMIKEIEGGETVRPLLQPLFAAPTG